MKVFPIFVINIVIAQQWTTQYNTTYTAVSNDEFYLIENGKLYVIFTVDN